MTSYIVSIRMIKTLKSYDNRSQHLINCNFQSHMLMCVPIALAMYFNEFFQAITSSTRAKTSRTGIAAS